MKAQVLRKIKTPLTLEDWPIPIPKKDEILLKVRTCGICRTDLHIIDGALPEPELPLILGHQIVGVVTGLGTEVTNFKIGDRVEVPWLGGSNVLRSSKRASTSMLQRRLKIGYNRAARIMEILEDEGIVGPENGQNPREILKDLDMAS